MFDIDGELKKAMRSGDKSALSVLRMLKSSLINARIANGHELDDAEIQRVLKKESKARADAAALYKSAAHEELAAKELSEKKFIDTFLPEMLSDVAIGDLVESVRRDMGETFTAQNFGQIMQSVLALAKGQADGATVSKIVKSKIGG